MFSAIAKPFGWLMMGLYDLLNNYGLALIAFALIVKIHTAAFPDEVEARLNETGAAYAQNEGD